MTEEAAVLLPKATASPNTPALPYSCQGTAAGCGKSWGAWSSFAAGQMWCWLKQSCTKRSPTTTSHGEGLPCKLLEESSKQSVDFLAVRKDLQEQKAGLVWLGLVFRCIKLCWQHSCPLFNTDCVYSLHPSERRKPLPHRLYIISQLSDFNKNSNTCKVFKQIMYIRAENPPRTLVNWQPCILKQNPPGDIW